MKVNTLNQFQQKEFYKNKKSKPKNNNKILNQNLEFDLILKNEIENLKTKTKKEIKK